MLSKKKIVVSVVVLLGSASATFGLDRNGTTHRGAPAVQRLAPAASYAARVEMRAVKPFSTHERIWFRLAEGPEWN
jgi:hypothetical protein